MLEQTKTLWLSALNLAQLAELNQLRTQCHQHDSGSPILYEDSLKKTRQPEVNGLIYYQNKLIAFISVYYFYQNACECSLMVKPNYRGLGLAKHLLSTITPILKSQKIQDVYFSAGYKFSVRPHANLSFNTSVYQLNRNLSVAIDHQDSQLSMTTAKEQHIPYLCTIDKQCFSDHPNEEMAERFRSLIDDPDYLILLGCNERQIIGKAHIRWHQNKAVFSDIAVLPKFQKQGFGASLLQACLDASQKRGLPEATLEVESKNERALNLYQKQGFTVSDCHNFWQRHL